MSVANLGLEPFKVRPDAVPPEVVPSLVSLQVVNELDEVASQDSRGTRKTSCAAKLVLSVFCSGSNDAT
jgi:hypothetical protein